MKQEIERKFAIKYIPKHIQIEKIVNIEQNFIYHDPMTIVRLRKLTPIYGEETTETRYIYTVKTKGDIQYNNKDAIAQKYEIENNITEEEYQTLIGRRIKKTIKKTRINIPIYGKLKVEVDIYYGYLDGFLTAEIEFPNKYEARKFRKPNWLGEELGYKELSNRKLSEMTQKQFRKRITRNIRKNNRKIIEEIRNRPEFQNKTSY